MNRVLLLYTDMSDDATALLRPYTKVEGPLSPQDDWQTPLRDADAVITTAHIPFTAQVMDGAPRLRVIARPGIGVDSVDLAAATTRGICVVNTPDAPTEPVAEKVVGWVLALAHRQPQADRVARLAGWTERSTVCGNDIVGKTIGLIGVGRVGGRVAQICSGALGMRVVVLDPYVNPERALQLGIEPVSSLDALLPLCDFLSLQCPLTAETRGMLGAREFRMFKPTAYFLNSARGAIVDEDALIQALREGWIAGAALDVMAAEPPSPDNPLLQMDNVILSPHIGSFTHEGVMRMSVGSADQVLMVLRGECPPNLVNPQVWDHRR